MKSLLFFLFLIFASTAYSQVITCNDNGCVPSSISATVQEKASHSAIDMGANVNESISIVTGTGNTTKSLRLNMQNGPYPGKNVNIDLSSNANNKNSGNIIVIGDNFDNLNVSLNGYNGRSGTDASQICATRILGGIYGSDVRLRFLQRRSSQSSLSNDRCVQADVDDIASTKFTCDDSSYTVLDPSTPSVAVTRVRQNAKCLAISPQNVCLQKRYKVSCSFKLGVKNPVTGDNQTWEEFKAYTRRTGCQEYGKCSDPAFQCLGNDYFRKNGSTVWSNGINETQPYQLTKDYYLYPNEINYYRTQSSSGNLCQGLINTDNEWKPSVNNFQAYVYYLPKINRSVSCGIGDSCSGCYQSEYREIHNFSSSSFTWIAQGNPNPVETSPGLASTGDRLQSGLGQHVSPNGNGAIREVNNVNNAEVCQGPVGQLPNNFVGGGGRSCSFIQGWQMETMPAFYPKGTFDESRGACNANFTFTSTKTENLVKTIFDPNQFSNGSSYCINRNNPENCSINPPFCDNPNSSVNCRKVSACEQINQRYCLDPTNSANCSKPPFCDNPSDPTNCSADLYAKSCESGGAAGNNFCDKDPNNITTYQFIGTEPDPLKNTEVTQCAANNCSVQNKTLESSATLDTLTPTNGESGTLPGQGLFFVYDIRSVSSQATPGQAGAGGKSDLTSANQIRYCGNRRDFTTDPNTNYENNPEVTFKKVNWKAFDVKGGGTPGSFPPFSNKTVEIFKKIDPSTRYLLKKELL